MTFINPALLFGFALATVPVVLHFMMRAKPKRVVFPALRLIQLRSRTNVRRMRLRHIWLLLLRIAVLALIVLAVARPTLPAANYGLTGIETLILAGIVVAGVTLYLLLVRHWGRSSLAPHVFVYRRTILRGSTGGVVAAAILLAVIWPYWQRVSAEMTAPMTNVAADLPVSAVLIFDTSPSMQYRQNNKTRLEEAKAIGVELLSSFAAGSRVTVMGSGPGDDSPEQADMAAAKARIEGLDTNANSVPLNNRVQLAVRQQVEQRERELVAGETGENSDRFVREIYVITDLAQSGWRMSSAEFLKNELAKSPWLSVYLIDVGSLEPTNKAVSAIQLSQQTATEGSQVSLTASVTTLRADVDEPIELQLRLRNPAGRLVTVDKTSLKIESESEVRDLEFVLPDVAGPIVQGEIRLTGSDPLRMDDVRHFTIAVQPAPKVLIVGESRAATGRWRWAMESEGNAVTFITANSLANAKLADFDAVLIINAENPTADHWGRLQRFVNQGGGVCVVLGSSSISADAYNNSDAAKAMLPGALVGTLGFLEKPGALDVIRKSDPLVAPIYDVDDSWAGLVNVYRRWSVRPYEDVTIIARYDIAISDPAILRRVVGKGRVLMLTFGDELNTWSDIADTWPFLALNDQIAQTLSGRSSSQCNFVSGTDVFVRIPRGITKPLVVRYPDLQQRPLPHDGESRVNVSDATLTGNYQVQESGASVSKTGFSVNTASDESDFQRLTEVQLVALFGEDRYSVSRNLAELDRIVTNTRMGEELFPYVLTLLLIIFCGEHFVANRFYESVAVQAEPHDPCPPT